MQKIEIPGLEFPLPESLGLLAPEEDQRKNIEGHVKDDMQRLESLCNAYEIQPGPDRYVNLALALARMLYPSKKKAGRKSKWTALNQGMLVVEVERLVNPDDQAHGVVWACEQLARREPWKSFLGINNGGNASPDSGEPLRKIYYAFQNGTWAKVSRDAFIWHQHTGDIAGWELLVEDCVKKPHSN